MISEFYAGTPPILDALPTSISEDFESLWYMLKDRIENDAEDLIVWLDHYLKVCSTSDHRLRYLCRLTVGFPGQESFYQKSDRQLELSFFKNDFAEWFAIRFIEVLFEHAGSTRIRQIRKEIAAEWLLVEQSPLSQQYEPLLARLLSFGFSVLLPLTLEKQPKGVASIANEIRQDIPRPKPRATTIPKPAVLPQVLAAICNPPFSTNDVRDLLIELRVLDPSTGYWHLGTLTGKAAKPLSAFPAAYRALAEAKHLDRVDGPVWRKLFQEEFKVEFSNRLANYAWGGNTSLEFDRYYTESKRWISKWPVKK